MLQALGLRKLGQRHQPQEALAYLNQPQRASTMALCSEGVAPITELLETSVTNVTSIIDTEGS